MNFSEAFDTVSKRKRTFMRLTQWSPDVKIFAQIPDDHSKMTAPYLYVQSRFGRVPWVPTQIELFANNWEVGYEKV